MGILRTLVTVAVRWHHALWSATASGYLAFLSGITAGVAVGIPAAYAVQPEGSPIDSWTWLGAAALFGASLFLTRGHAHREIAEDRWREMGSPTNPEARYRLLRSTRCLGSVVSAAALTTAGMIMFIL